MWSRRMCFFTGPELGWSRDIETAFMATTTYRCYTVGGVQGGALICAGTFIRTLVTAAFSSNLADLLTCVEGPRVNTLCTNEIMMLAGLGTV